MTTKTELQDRIADEADEYYERRFAELSQTIARRDVIHYKIQAEIAEIEANRNAP